LPHSLSFLAISADEYGITLDKDLFLKYACAHTKIDFTIAQWQNIFPEKRYDPTCKRFDE